MSAALLGAHIKLVLSSEWNYSPLTYRPLPPLPDFVLIGLPASETGNALLVPLAGHELGHSLWRSRNLYDAFTPAIQGKILSDIQARWQEFQAVYPLISRAALSGPVAIRVWSPAAAWANRQLEETFCDFTGLALFGAAYLHAFAYLLAPSTENRVNQYPPMQDRVQNLIAAAHDYGVDAPSDYASMFLSSARVSQPGTELHFLLTLADSARQSLVPDVMREAKNLVAQSALSPPSRSTAERIAADRFRFMVPSSGQESLADVINAGWLAAHDHGLWRESGLEPARRLGVLKDLLLKSAEVIELTALVGT